MNSTAKYHPHEKVTRSLGKYNAVAYYHAKDFTNQQRSYRLDKLEERVQRLEKKYDTIQRFEKSAKELEQAAYRITGTTRKKGFFEFIISGAKQFAQKYKDYRKYNGNKR